MTTRGGALSDRVYRLFADLVRRRTGYVLTEAHRPRLETRLSADARAAGSFYQLFGLLRNEPTSSPAFGRLLDAAVNSETYFFRDPPALRAFAEEIAPERLLAAGTDGSLEVWSAGCATGEEAYTLAMLLLEKGALPGRRARVLGTDLSPANIRRARAALYGPHSLRATSPERVRAHFEPADGGLARVRSAVRSAVAFDQRGILDDAAGGAAFDVIVCRNVLIYLDEEARSRAVSVFCSRLKPGGYMLLGASDALAAAAAPLTLVRLANDVAYRR